VQLHEAPHVRQAEAQTDGLARARAVGLPETVEHDWQERGGDALAAVRHADLGVPALPAEVDVHAPVLRGELDRVGHEVPHDLLEPIGVAHERPRAVVEQAREAHLLGVRGRPHHLERGAGHRGEVDRADVDAELAADDPRDVEQVVDELRLRPGVALDDLERVRDCRLASDSAARTTPSIASGVTSCLATTAAARAVSQARAVSSRVYEVTTITGMSRVSA